MRKYETFFIIDPDLPDETVAVAEDKIRAVVTSNKGEVITYVSWGKKKLAYPVKKRTRGHYILMEYSGGPELVAELERNMRLDERVLKFITVKLDDRFDPQKEEARKAVTPPLFGEDEEGGAQHLQAVEGDEEDGEDDLTGEEAGDDEE
jgi:small subunit ribosomal protein S6